MDIGIVLELIFHLPNDDIVGYADTAMFIKVLDLMLKHWQPAFAKHYSKKLILEREEYDFGHTGWLTYYSKDFGPLPILPEWAIVTPVEKFGTSILASEELLDEHNPEHIRRLTELNSILEPFWEANWQKVDADNM